MAEDVHAEQYMPLMRRTPELLEECCRALIYGKHPRTVLWTPNCELHDASVVIVANRRRYAKTRKTKHSGMPAPIATSDMGQASPRCSPILPILL